MKFNFKKISAIVTSMLVTGMSVGVAAAANYPAPFVQGGVANVAIVYGTGSGVSTLDLVQAGNIQSHLQSSMGTTSGGTASEVVGGDSVQISKSTDSFNLGDNLNAFYSTLDSDELSNLLADGTYKNDDNDEFEYEQEVVLGSMVLQHFTDNDFNDEKPVIGFDISGGTTLLTYTLDFTPDNAESDESDWNSLEGTTIELLGKQYYILSASNTSQSLELLDSASNGVLNEGETITLDAGENTYEVSISFIGTSSVKMVVNGETTPSLGEDDTYKLDSGDYLGIKEINTQDYQGGIKQVEFSIGSGKIELIDGEEIEVNGEDVSDLEEYDGYVLDATVTQTSNNLDSLSITWKTDTGTSGDRWLAYGTDSKELVMPVFKNLKLSLGNFVTGAGEVTSVEPDGDDSFVLDTEITDGEVSLNLLYTNGTHITGIGAGSTEKLVTSANSTINWDEDSSYFVATWWKGDDYESYVLEVTDIEDSTNETTIESVASGKAIVVQTGDSKEIGELSFTVDAANESAGTATITFDYTGTGETLSSKTLITKEGMKIALPVNAGSGAGAVNLTAGFEDTTWNMEFTEEDSDGDIALGDLFYATLSMSDEETTVSAVNLTEKETEDGSDKYVAYVASDLSTKTLRADDNPDTLEVTYYGAETYGEVYVSEVAAEIVTGETVTTGSATPLGEILVMDNEISSVSSKNLIIVGGSCINSAAATVLGGAYCGTAFTEKTGVGSGQFLIQGFNGAITSGKLALVVAGYDAADTVNAATYLKTKTVDTSKKYIGTSATSAEMVVDTA